MKTFPEFMRFQVPIYYGSEAKSKGQGSLWARLNSGLHRKLLPNIQDPLQLSQSWSALPFPFIYSLTWNSLSPSLCLHLVQDPYGVTPPPLQPQSHTAPSLFLFPVMCFIYFLEPHFNKHLLCMQCSIGGKKIGRNAHHIDPWFKGDLHLLGKRGYFHSLI